MQTVWQVDEARASWLTPLHRRLLEAIEWDQPESLRKADVELATFPNSRVAQRTFAREQIRAGDWRDGVQRLWTVLQERVDSSRAWTDALEDLRPVLTRLDEPDRWLDGALRNAPVPRVIEEVAKALDELDRRDEAVGLLELAWRQAPGDRRLRRARRRLGLPREVDSRSGRPWEEVYDPLTGQSRARSPRVPVPAELSLRAARAEGERVHTERDALVAQTVAWVQNEDRRAVAPLLFLAGGHVDLEDGDDRKALFDELSGVVDGRDLPWLPEPLTDAIRRHPRTLDKLRER